MNIIKIYFIAAILLTGCVKKIEPKPDKNKKNSYSDKFSIENNPTKNTPTSKQVPSLKKIDTVLDEIENTSKEKKILDSLTKSIEQPIKDINVSLDLDQILPDSVWTQYMTKRGDYLSLIAYNEYGNPNEWQRIYNWNKKYWEERKIGPNKENPNFIYPYKELDLKKPSKDVIEWAYEHYMYTVSKNESLWSIAQKVYNDELAWVVLFWDNENLINKNNGKIFPGMEIKVRLKLWPIFE